MRSGLAIEMLDLVEALRARDLAEDVHQLVHERSLFRYIVSILTLVLVRRSVAALLELDIEAERPQFLHQAR